ncbi:hypothetical protein RIVM261_032250 [Rivularia sp. IAM M-261]|nr:hypothetical protein RIVM261_032250 [Rivularia sp. IAM M-261]
MFKEYYASRFKEIFGSPLQTSDGLGDELVQVKLQQLGLKIPEALAQYYAVTGLHWINAEDFLTILDVEEALLNGQVIRIEKDDPRGTKYIVVGTALDQQTPVGIVGRFASNGRYLIITVYEVTDLEG